MFLRKIGGVIMQKLKPPIARMGGKSKLRNEIIQQLPEHKCYCEVFFWSWMGVFWKRGVESRSN